jgi:hypothetical protein
VPLLLATHHVSPGCAQDADELRKENGPQGPPLQIPILGGRSMPPLSNLSTLPASL